MALTGGGLPGKLTITGHNGELLQDFWFGHVELKGLTANTRRGYKERLGYLMRYAESLGKSVDELTRQELQRYFVDLMQRVSRSTVNGQITYFKVFYQYLTREGLLTGENPMANISRIAEDHKIKKPLTEEQTRRLLSLFHRNQFTGARNYLMTVLALDTWARISEIVSLRIEDCDLQGRVVILRQTKARRDRPAAITPVTAKEIHRWLYRWRSQLPGDRLFCYSNGDPMAVDRFRKTLQPLARRIGIDVLGPHLLRRTGIWWAIKGGMNLELARRQAGHADIRMTQNYVLDGEFEAVQMQHERSSIINRIA